MITTFGRFIRDLRHRHAELLKDMAEKLQVSPAFLSGVESGKKSIPAGWENALIDEYQLPTAQQKLLRIAIDESQRNVIINLDGMAGERRGVAVALARQFDQLSDSQLQMIKQTMLNSQKRTKGE